MKCKMIHVCDAFGSHACVLTSCDVETSLSCFQSIVLLIGGYLSVMGLGA